MSNADRGIVLAERSANPANADPRLNVADTVQADRMGKLSRGLNYTGKAAGALDGALRIGKVKATYDEGGDWLKEGSRQMVGFGFAGVATGLTTKGVIAGGTAAAASLGLISAGPIGWAVLGVTIGTGVLVGLGAGYFADYFGKEIADMIWEW